MIDLQKKEVCGFLMAYRPGTPDEVILRQSFDKDPFLPEMPRYSPQPGHVVVEVGAHIGSFTVNVSTKTCPGKYFAIEACAETASILEENVRANRCSNVECFRMAISDTNGSCRLNYSKPHGNWAHSIVHDFGDGGEEVSCCTLERFFDNNSIESCDLLKMNCEGAEFPIVMGLPDRIASRIRNITLEFHSHLWPANTKDDLMERLRQIGFWCELRHFDGLNGWIVAGKQEV